MNEYIEQLIALLVWLDESNAAYLVMLACFLAMGALHSVQSKEVTRLRKLLKQAMR
jgi:hypothetical protein